MSCNQQDNFKLEIDENIVQKAMEESNGDIFEFANLLAKQVGPIDDEDELLPEQTVGVEEECLEEINEKKD